MNTPRLRGLFDLLSQCDKEKYAPAETAEQWRHAWNAEAGKGESDGRVGFGSLVKAAREAGFEGFDATPPPPPLTYEQAAAAFNRAAERLPRAFRPGNRRDDLSARLAGDALRAGITWRHFEGLFKLKFAGDYERRHIEQARQIYAANGEQFGVWRGYHTEGGAVAVDRSVTRLRVKKYLAEQGEAIDKALRDNDVCLIHAPTGTGKTRFATDIMNDRAEAAGGVSVMLTATIEGARQAAANARKRGIAAAAIDGEITLKEAMLLMRTERVIFGTYDAAKRYIQ